MLTLALTIIGFAGAISVPVFLTAIAEARARVSQFDARTRMKSVAIVRHPAPPVSYQSPHRARQNTPAKSGASVTEVAFVLGFTKRLHYRTS